MSLSELFEVIDNALLASADYRSLRDEALMRALSACQPDYVREGSEVVTLPTLMHTIDLINKIPSATMAYKTVACEVKVDDDGALTLRWYASHQQLLDVSVSNKGIASWAWVRGSISKHGTFAVAEGWPDGLLNIIMALNMAKASA